MGIWDAFVEAVTPWSNAEAEAPPAEEKQEEETATETKESADTATPEPEEKEGESSEEKEEEPAEEEEEEEEEEEDEEEEIVDPKETLEEECKNAPQCAPAKHHYDHCVERVEQQESEGGAKEDCVEEFFHLAHCATACAAPKLWSKLK